MIKIASLSLLMLLLSPVAGAEEANPLPDNVNQLRQMANRAHASGDKEAFRDIVAQLHTLRPYNSQYMYQLVLAHAVLGELTPAFNMMLEMQRQGLSYDFNKSPDSMNLRDKDLYDYLNDLMIKAGEPMGEFSIVASLDPELGRVDAIDWDPGREAFLVGTVTDGRLLAVGRDGSFRELLRADKDNGLWGIHDLVVDSERNRLWVTSTASRAFSGFDVIDKGRSSLFEFKLDSLERVKTYPAPVDGLPHNLGTVSLSPDGTLYLADHSQPIIYMLQPGQDRLMPIFASNGLVALRDLAVSASGKALYVADREMGVIRLDLAAGDAKTLARSETLNLGGIDGLEIVDDDLLVIQNGIRPQRIMRLILDEAGTGVAEVAPVIVAPAGLSRPSYGTVLDNRLYFLARADTGMEQAGRKPLRIVETGVEGLQNIVPPDMKRYLEQQSRERMQRPTPLMPGNDAPGKAGDEEDPDGQG